MTTLPPPEVVVLPLDEALALLDAGGWRVTIVETGPPNAVPEDDRCRVIRQRTIADGGVGLTVAAETVLRKPRGAARPGP